VTVFFDKEIALKVITGKGPAVALALCLLTGLAYADPETNLDWNEVFFLKIVDHTTFFDISGSDLGTPIDPAAPVIQPGLEARTWFKLTSIEDIGGNYVWGYNPIPGANQQEVTGLMYDLVVASGNLVYYDGSAWQTNATGGVVPNGTGGYDVYFVGGNRYPTSTGRIDAYFDDASLSNTVADVEWHEGPDSWAIGGTADSYGTENGGSVSTDGLLWATGTFRPIFYDSPAGRTGFYDPAVDILNAAFIDNNGNLTYDAGIDDPVVYSVTGGSTPGAGTAKAWINVDGGSFNESADAREGGSNIWPEVLSNGMELAGYDMYLQSTLQVDQSGYGWLSLSNDPVKGVSTPEPASMLLFGSALVGCVAALRKRNR
jgi:hypothetical protein